MQVSEKSLKILAVDDTEMNLNLLARFFSKKRHELVTAANGQEAIERFTSEGPDLILMDVMMPVMDGYEATREIRKLSGDKWIPIIFMSAKAATEDQVAGLDAGGDDYLTKPVNMRILAAKIKAMQRIAEMRDALSEQTAELEQYRANAEEEKYLGNALMERMTRAGKMADELLDSWLLPAEHMSGDLVAACRGGDDRFYVMVADATGHGLLAAMMQIPVSQTFYHMTSQDYSLSRIVRSINSQLRVLVPRDRFVAATVVMVDVRNRLIEIWNGGGPEALFVDARRNIVHRFESNAAPLGIVSDEEFEPFTQVYQWSTPGELLVCSDGAVDALNSEGEPFGEARLEQALSSFRDQSICMAVAEALREYLQGRRAQDDISVVSVTCPEKA
ncbi:MAG TPA: fused response regulator/phosphatase [Gammaproteobacteria bacterium]|nr:fused response regulator/phosphatase [Gammaproteobacteria bacterium]